MTDNEWILYCILMAIVIIVVVYFLHDYPIGEAINQTKILVTGAS